MGWELEWYAQYLQALEELTPRLQSAVRDGKLTPRGIMTRAPLDLGQLRPWFELDAKATIAASAKSLWTDAEPELDEAPRWADALVLPAGAFVTIDDFRAWAESEGIAAPGEVAALLRDPTDAPPSVFAESQEQPDTAHSGATEKAATEVTPTDDDEQGEAAPPATEQKADDDAELAALFDPVKVATLEAMFPDGNWSKYAERAARNGLKDAARTGRGEFNPYSAAVWSIDRGPDGWKWERCLRVLANNLPLRSRDPKHLLTGEFD